MKLLGQTNPDLYKFCDDKHNVANGCNTIRIGTLYGFRTEEKEKLRDEGEGQIEYAIEFPEPTPVSREWLSEFETFGGGSARIGHMEINYGQIKIGAVTLSGSHANCWIYCVSMGTEAVGNISEEHSSKWRIPGDAVSQFGQTLANLLWESITFDDLPEYLVRHNSLTRIQRGLSLNFAVQPVQYSDRKIKICKEEDFPISRVQQLKRDVPFIKPLAFEDEREVRFAFKLSFEGKDISIPDRAKIVSLRPIDEIFKG